MQVVEDAGDRWSAANPATLVDRQTGKVWLFYLRGKPGANTNTARPGTDDILILARTSTDQGRTWSEPLDLTTTTRDFADGKWRTSVVGPGGAVQDRRGRLIIPLWRFEPYSVFAAFSEDQGQTWQRGQIAPGLDGDECQLVELSDGRLLMDVRQQKEPHRFHIFSGDGGRTWSAPQPGQTVSPVCCAIERLPAAAGTDERDRILWTGPKGPKRANLVVRVSADDARTFPAEKLIYSGPAAYSDLTILPDRSVGVLYERGTQHAYEFLSFTRFNSAWVAAP
jgi:sialidase-1